MSKAALSILLFLIGLNSIAQKQSSGKINVGVEQDLLPYLTGGYFAGVWAGKDHLRFRALTAKVNKPDCIIKKGFSHNKVQAFALIADYFLKKDWKGWWAGTGLVYWKNSLQTDEKVNTTRYENFLLNGSVGYAFQLHKNLYISPWVGMHIRIAGDKKVIVDDKTFTPPLLNPEASVKFGVHF